MILAWLKLDHSAQYFFLRVVKVSIEIVPFVESFVDPNSPIFKYLDFLLPVIEPSFGHLRLWVTHLLIQQGYHIIPRSLIHELLYLMGRKDGDADILANTYPTTWKTKITAANESQLHQDYSIPSSIKLHFDVEDIGIVVRTNENEDENEV